MKYSFKSQVFKRDVLLRQRNTITLVLLHYLPLWTHKTRWHRNGSFNIFSIPFPRIQLGQGRSNNMCHEKSLGSVFFFKKRIIVSNYSEWCFLVSMFLDSMQITSNGKNLQQCLFLYGLANRVPMCSILSTLKNLRWVAGA